MLPLSSVRVPNAYKRLDLRSDNSFWEVWELLTLVKITSYHRCCADPPIFHPRWAFLARSSMSLLRSKFFFFFFFLFYPPIDLSIYSTIRSLPPPAPALPFWSLVKGSPGCQGSKSLSLWTRQASKKRILPQFLDLVSMLRKYFFFKERVEKEKNRKPDALNYSTR